jgi:signal transduction histidine kinase
VNSSNKSIPEKFIDLTVLAIAALATYLLLGAVAWFLFQSHESIGKILPNNTRLERLQGTITHLDEVLTMSARMAASTGDVKWEKRYKHFEPMLNKAIKTAITLAPNSQEWTGAKETASANIKLVTMEGRAFELIRSGRQQEAQKLLFSKEYKAQKNIYSNGMLHFSQVLSDTAQKLQDANGKRIHWSFGVIGTAILFLSIIWFFVFRILRASRTQILESNLLLVEQAGKLETHREQLTEQVKERTTDLESANKYLSMNEMGLREINRLQEFLIAPGETSTKLREITDTAVNSFKQDFCRIWIVRPGDLCEKGCVHAEATDTNLACKNREKCLHLVASSGRYTHIDGGHQRVPLGAYKIGIIAAGEADELLTNQVTTDPRIHHHKWAKSLGLVAFAGYKLQEEEGETIGVLGMFSKHPILERDAAFLLLLSRAASHAISAGNVDSKLQEAKDDAESANLAKSLFLAHMSHEIRTPLNTIIGMGEMLSESITTPENQRYITAQIRASEGLLALINDILDLSKIEAGEMSLETATFDLHELVDASSQIVAVHAQDKGLILDYKIDNNVQPLVIGDSQRLRQILLNLLGNAIKFTERGRIQLDVSMTKPGQYQFAVSDTGVGISPFKLESIFSPFSQADNSVTREYGGTGLGLAICRQLVEVMGGWIWVESQLGKGSTFFFSVPFQHSDSKKSQASSDATRIQSKEGNTAFHPENDVYHILLAEDAEENQLVIQAYLKRTPYKVDIAHNGAVALDKFQCGNYDAVLMDIQMPVMDGNTATKKIREWEAEVDSGSIPIIALTAHAMKEDTQITLDAGCDIHLTKPIRKARLLEVLNQFVGQGKHAG